MTSPTLDALSDAGERLWWRLTVAVDDHGRFEADPAIVLARCFPRRAGSPKLVAAVVGALCELRAADLICLYRLGERLYGAIVQWNRYQRHRDSRPKHPSTEGAELLDPPQFAATCRNLPQLAARARACAQAGVRETRAVSREPRDESREAGDPPQLAAGPASRSWSDFAWGTPEALGHLYNTSTPDNVPAIETMQGKRRERAARVLREYPERDWWVEVFGQYHASRFLSGKVAANQGHEKFRPDFDWLLSVGKSTGIENYVRVHDGAYA